MDKNKDNHDEEKEVDYEFDKTEMILGITFIVVLFIGLLTAGLVLYDVAFS